MKTTLFTTAAAVMAALLTGCSTVCPTEGALSWQKQLEQAVPVYGHRNWIVVADSAYPSQSNPAITTIYTGSTQTEVLAYVLRIIEEAPHIQAVVMTDAELAAVKEEAAPGIEAYRKELEALLEGKQVSAEPHEDIIRKLDEDAKLFNVLLLKTDMTIPYTSVFIRLDCGYWDAEREAQLQDSL